MYTSLTGVGMVCDSGMWQWVIRVTKH